MPPYEFDKNNRFVIHDYQHQYPFSSTLPGIAQAKDVLNQMNSAIADIKQLEREIISLHKTQRELFRGQKRKK